MKSILPIILVVLALTGAITYSLAKRVAPSKPVVNVVTPSPTPTPTIANKVSFTNVIATPSVTIPEVTEKAKVENTAAIKTKGGVEKTAVTTTTKTIICTPVYGSADTCTEHIVVDTGAESAMFFNFAGLAYLGGLVSFVKAKSLKR